MAFVSCARRPSVPPCDVAILQEVRARAKHMTSEQVTQVAATLCEEVRHAKLDPLLALALVDLESGYDASIVSSQGAVGLMQLMPPTAAAVAKRHGLRPPADGSQDPAFNVTLGIRYLADLRGEFQSLERALLAYNLGPPATHALVRAHGAGFDATAQPFLIQVTKRFESLRSRYAPPPS
jgi:soluble lytic murein transglycosylase